MSNGRLALDLVEFLRGMGYLARIEDETAVEAILPPTPTAPARHDLVALLRVWEREHGARAALVWHADAEGARA